MIDKALRIASLPDVIFCSFGDMLRVPGSTSDLFSIRANGGHIRVVYSPLDAIKIAQENPEKEIVFFAIGFETTAPANISLILQAEALDINNVSVLVSQVCVPPAMHAILGSTDNRVQGFLAAGHVCSVMGYWEYSTRYFDGNPPIGKRLCKGRKCLLPRGHPGRQQNRTSHDPESLSTIGYELARNWINPPKRLGFAS
jgi:hydrogenase expression/formation protein HypD